MTFLTKTVEISTTSAQTLSKFPPRSKSRHFRDLRHSNQKAFYAIMASFLIDLLSDLTLSGIAYFALAVALNHSVEHVIELLSPSWTLPQLALSDIPYETIVFSIAFIHWSIRLFFRYRGHFRCAWKSLAYILRWLSPLHPKPLKTCPCCWIRTHGDPATGLDSRLQDQGRIRRPDSIERMSSCPPSPALMLPGEQRCLTFDSSSHSPADSLVSADDTMNEWRDVEKSSDDGRREGSLSPVADESTSGWRDLACSSEN